MSKPSDVRGKPGDIVLLRGLFSRAIWDHDPTGSTKFALTEDLRGMLIREHARPGSMGIIVHTNFSHYTYVLWSNPYILGYVDDGYLRPC